MADTLLNPYCLADEVLDEMKIAAGDVDADEITRAINHASRWVDDYKGRDFFEHDHTSSALLLDDHDEDPSVFDRVVFLPYRPIIGNLTEVKVGTTVFTEDVDYAITRSGNRLIRLGGNWDISAPDLRLSIKGKFGYDQGGVTTAVPTGLPSIINLATILVAAAISGHNRKELQAFDGSKITINDREIPQEVLKMLGNRHKILM